MFSIIEFETVDCCNYSIPQQKALRRDAHARIQNVQSEWGPNLAFSVFFIFSINEGRDRIKMPL